MVVKRITLDETLRPLEMTCGKCGNKMKAYPSSEPAGIGYCPTCSPAWLKSFAEFCMNAERTKHGLVSIT